MVLSSCLAARVATASYIDRTKTKAESSQTNGTCRRFRNTVLEDPTKSPSASNRSVDDLQGITILGCHSLQLVCYTFCFAS